MEPVDECPECNELFPQSELNTFDGMCENCFTQMMDDSHDDGL